MRKIVKRGIVLVLAITTTIVLAGAADYMLANKAATDYQRDFLTWKTTYRPQLIKNTSFLPAGVYAFSSETKTKSIEKQQIGCDGIKTVRQNIETLSEATPQLGVVPFGNYVKAYVDQSTLAQKRQQLIDAYVSESRAIFSSLAADCAWNIGLNKDASDSTMLFEKATNQLQQKGETQNGRSCSSDDGCLPAGKAQLTNYAQTYKKASAAMKKVFENWLAVDKCGVTSLSNVCEKLRVFKLKAADTRIAYADGLIRSNNIDNVISVNEQKTKLLNEGDAKELEVLQKAFSDYKLTKAKQDNGSTDGYLFDIALGKINDLKNRQNALIAL